MSSCQTLAPLCSAPRSKNTTCVDSTTFTVCPVHFPRVTKWETFQVQYVFLVKLYYRPLEEIVFSKKWPQCQMLIFYIGSSIFILVTWNWWVFMLNLHLYTHWHLFFAMTCTLISQTSTFILTLLKAHHTIKKMHHGCTVTPLHFCTKKMLENRPEDALGLLVLTVYSV